jgi:hypothetical protein
MEKNEARQKRRELRPKGRQAYLVSTPVFSEGRAVRSRTATTSSTAPAMPEGGYSPLVFISELAIFSSCVPDFVGEEKPEFFTPPK